MGKDLISQNLNYNIDIAVISCDNYSDVWPFFFDNLFKNWEDCPLQIHLISNKKTYNHKKIINVNIGEDVSWSDNLRKGLKSLKKEYVMLFIDDLIVDKIISVNYFNKISKWINYNKPNYLRLHISFKPNYYDNFVGTLPKKSPYKVSLMPSIWNKNFLKTILRTGESAWDFEIKGTKRAFNFNGFFSLNKNFIHYNNSIIKGKWQRSTIKNLKIKNSHRLVMSPREQFLYNLMVYRSKIFNLLPNNIKLKLKKL